MSNAPFTDLQFGIANWQDYVNNWREADAEYLQARTIARFQDANARNAGLPAPSPGQVVYNQGLDWLELRSKNNTWISYRGLPQNMTVTTDDVNTVTLAHSASSGKGISLGAAQVDIPGKLVVFNGVTTTDSTGLAIKVGAKTAKLTTDAASLISDTQISAPSIALTGTGTVLSAPGKTVAVGTLTADAATITSITLGGTLTGGVINGTSGTIGGVAHSGNTAASFVNNRVTASDGLLASGARFRGDGSAAIMQSNSGGPYIQVGPGGGAFTGGGQFDFYTNVRFLNNTVPVYFYASNSGAINIAPTIYSGGDPGAGNFPDGTIWVT